MNIKKLLFLLMFVLLLGFGCDCSSNTDDECKHEIESVASKEATCTNEGNVEYFYCTKCNKYYIDKELTKEKSYDELVIVKKGHNYSDYEVKKEATEDEVGIKVRKCNTCGEEEIHSFDYTGNEVDINESFVTIDENTYYVANNNKVKNYYIIDDVMYDFGNDGVKQETVLTDIIITFEDNLYYVINNVIQKNTYVVYKQNIYYFDENGKALINTTYNGYTFGVDGYLIADDLIITINEVIYEVINNIASVHKHNWSEEITKESTCTEEGLKTIKCTKCLEEKTEVIPAGHMLTDWIIDTEATCTENGSKHKECSVCKKTVETEVIPAGHMLTDWIIDTEATCTETGSKHKECSACKKTVETEIIPATNHNWSEEITKESTCTEEGIKTIKCAKCLEEKTEVIPLKEHMLTDWIIDAEATCTETGSKHKECSVCENIVKTEVIPATNHNWSEEITKESTCTEEGIKTIKCAKCLEEKIEAISLKEHTLTEWIIDTEATCTQTGSKHKECSVCKNIVETEVILATNHNWSEEITKESTCTEEGIKTIKCAKCLEEKIEVIPLKEHTLTDWIIDTEATCTQTGSKHKECTICENIIETETIAALGHNYINNICTKCNIKGYIYFGEYPQTLKEESVTIVSDAPDSDGYYLGSDGERYVKIVAKPYSYSTSYFNNKIEIIEGTTYYFKVEPIRWKIEEQSNGTYKLISDLIIDCQKYYSSEEKRTIDGKTIYANNYKYSDIRSWLNNDFLNKAFTEELQEYINVTEVDNSALSTGYSKNEYACENTMDKIYLPSYEEMCKYAYGYSTDYSEKDYARQKQLTDYAKAMGCYMNTSDNYYNNGGYWLRSPDSNYSDLAHDASPYGHANYLDSVYGGCIGVAPALTIQID